MLFRFHKGNSPSVLPSDKQAAAHLAATGNFEEIPMHIRATANTGASKEDVLEAFQHVAIYAGVPKANHAIKLAKATYEDMEKEK